MKLSKLLPILLALGATISVTTQAAVQNVAFLQGNTLENGSPNLSVAEPTAIAWGSGSSIDPTVFDHAFDANHQLVVKKDGDYLVSYTVPMLGASGARQTNSMEVYVNGEPAAGTLCASTYIRNANNHLESSAHNAALLQLSAGDVIEAKTLRLNAAGSISNIETASLYVELIDNSRSVFAGTATQTVGGPNLNQDDFSTTSALQWTSSRKDAAFSHSGNSATITLPETGDYLVFVNIPMTSAGARTSVGVSVLLNGSKIPGGRAEQGYIRNATNHDTASIHWSGLVRAIFPGQTLTFITAQRSGITADVTVPAGKAASVYVEKVDTSSGVYSSGAFGPGDIADWNPPEKTTITWLSPEENIDSIIDTGVYSHSTGSGEITVRQDGDYLLVYNDNIEGGNARVNPKVTVQVNGSNVPGAETKTHYIRNADSHVAASASLVHLLTGLKSNDVVTVSVEQEGNTAGVFAPQDDFIAGLLFLQKKLPFVPDPNDPTPPRIVFFGGNIDGFEVRIEDVAIALNPDTVEATVNGQAVATEVTKVGGSTTVIYQFDDFPVSLSTHEVQLSYSDADGNAHSFSLSFTVTEIFTEMDPTWIVEGVNTSAPGFVARVTQIGLNVHGSSTANAENQLRGTYVDPDTGELYPNEANLNFTTGWVVNPVNVPGVINWEQDALSAGNFNDGNGFPDVFIPGIPGNFQSTDGIVAEMITFLDLPAGFYTLGVNSDDGFKVSTGTAIQDSGGRTDLGEFNGARGSADTLFDVLVREGGIYPFRLLWYEGDGGANVEFFSVVDGEKILINDSSNANAIKAYREGPLPSFVSRTSPTSGIVSSTAEVTIDHGSLDVSTDSVTMTIDGEEVAATVRKSGNSTIVTFNNGADFPPGAHVVSVSWEETTDPTPRSSGFAFFVSPGIVQDIVINDTPAIYLTLGNSVGNTTFASAGTGIDGRLDGDGGGPSLVKDRAAVGAPNGALFFDRSKNQSIFLADHEATNNTGGNPGTTNRSYELWFQSRNLPTSSDDLAVQRSNRQIIFEEGGTTRGISIYLDGTQTENPTEANLHFLAWNLAETVWGGTATPLHTDGSTDISTPIQPGVPYHIVYVFDTNPDVTGSLTAYVNGEMVGQVNNAGLLFNHTDDTGLGGSYSETAFHDGIQGASESLHFDGSIDEFAVYDGVSFDSAKVKAHYDSGSNEVPFEGQEPPEPPADGGPASIAISTDTDGNIVLTFEGALWSAEQVEGPFETVDGASSPMTVAAEQARRFYQTGN